MGRQTCEMVFLSSRQLLMPAAEMGVTDVTVVACKLGVFNAILFLLDRWIQCKAAMLTGLI